MSATTLSRQVSATAKVPQEPANKNTDKAALRAIAQAAVEVELFTIPLYLTTLYSIQGMHQITSKGNDLYEGRLWPGAATTAGPQTANEGRSTSSSRCSCRRCFTCSSLPTSPPRSV